MTDLNPAFIDPHQLDNSSETKDSTYWSEWVDFLQFMLMTTITEGIDAGAKYGFGKENFIPTHGIIGLDMVAYLFMIGLAYERQKKFKIRRESLRDKNKPDYYTNTAKALFDALTDEEKSALDAERDTVEPILYLTYLLKSDSKALNKTNLPDAWNRIDRWNNIFARVKQRPHYRKDQEKASAVALRVLQKYAAKGLVITQAHAEKLLAELALIQKTTPLNDIQKKEYALLAHYGITESKTAEAALAELAAFYEEFHSHQDRNDKAFYLSNKRGILEFEQNRTKFKQYLYSSVLVFSLATLCYSANSMTQLINGTLPTFQLLLPIFIVGTTSLVDEAADLGFKVTKYRKCKKDLSDWMKHAENSAAYALFNEKDSSKLTEFYTKNQNLIQVFSLGVRKDDEKFDLEKHGQMYLEAKRNQHQELEDRVERRWIKTKQAMMSFTGVFFGVALAMSMNILTILYEHEANQALFATVGAAVDNIAFAGFATIAIAAAGGMYMIWYQNKRKHEKADMFSLAHEKEIQELQSVGASTGYPVRMSQPPVDDQREITADPHPHQDIFNGLVY